MERLIKWVVTKWDSDVRVHKLDLVLLIQFVPILMEFIHENRFGFHLLLGESCLSDYLNTARESLLLIDQTTSDFVLQDIVLASLQRLR